MAKVRKLCWCRQGLTNAHSMSVIFPKKIVSNRGISSSGWLGMRHVDATKKTKNKSRSTVNSKLGWNFNVEATLVSWGHLVRFWAADRVVVASSPPAKTCSHTLSWRKRMRTMMMQKGGQKKKGRGVEDQCWRLKTPHKHMHTHLSSTCYSLKI